MSERAETLENNPNEWGEHMDLQAAAIFHDVEIDVAIKIRTRQVYVDQVHSYNRNGRRSKNAKKGNRLVYFDGRSHFQVAHKVQTLNKNCLFLCRAVRMCACPCILCYRLELGLGQPCLTTMSSVLERDEYILFDVPGQD